MKVRSSDSVVKIWCCIFTCFTTRAVHLELLSDMTTSEFLRCFRRFVARRGCPKLVLSNNAPQFKLASDTLAAEFAKADKIQQFCSKLGIQWKFITEHSPWQGGLYERMVGLVKRSLRKALGRSLVTFVELGTIVTEVEAVLNSRPLTYIDADGCEMITPSHFLNIHSSVGPCIPSVVDNVDDVDDDEYVPVQDSADHLRSQFKRMDVILNQFWIIWKREYLLSLRERSVSHKSRKNESSRIPKVGKVVTVEEKDCSRCLWKMGRIVGLHKSDDGEVRSVDV